MTATTVTPPARTLLDALAELVERYPDRDGVDVHQLLAELGKIVGRGRAAVRRARVRDGGRDATPTAATEHPAPISDQDSRPAQGRSDTTDTRPIPAGTSQLVANSVTLARAVAGAAAVRVERPDDRGGRGTNPAAASTTRPAPSAPMAAGHDHATGEVARQQGESPVEKPATASAALVSQGQAVSAVAGREDSAHGVVLGLGQGVQAPGQLRVVDRHAAQDLDRQRLEPLSHVERRSWQVLVGHEPAGGVLDGAVPAAGEPPERVAGRLLEVGLHGPTVARRWPRAVLRGLVELAALVAALLAVLLGAAAAGEIAHQDVVPATAVGAALLAGMLVGRVTAPAVAATITRRRRRAQTVAPTRAAT